MRLLFLERSSLHYKDYAIVGTDFDLIIDSVVSQKSNFVANKEKINANVGDIVVLNEKRLSFIGILESMTLNDDKTTLVQLVDFKEMFDIEVPVSSFEGDLAGLLKDTIEKTFCHSSDDLQNLSYLKVNANTIINGSISYPDDSLVKINDLIELLAKSYGAVISFKTTFLRGRFENIVVDIDINNNELSLRSDLASISNLEIKQSEKDVINKCVFYPKKDNAVHKDVVTFYLLVDGTVTKEDVPEKRYPSVNVKSGFYSDKEYDALESKAVSEMSSISSDHQITFDLDTNNFSFIPLKNLFLGNSVAFYHHGRKYNTILTQIRYKGNFNIASLTLGEQRNSLTDRIKMISSGTSTGKTVSVANTANTDGGTY